MLMPKFASGSLGIAPAVIAIAACTRIANAPSAAHEQAGESKALPGPSATPQAEMSAAASKPSAAPATPLAENASSEPTLGERDLEREESRRTPKAVERELEEFEKTYEPLPPLRRLPDHLSVDAVLALLPDDSETEYLRDGIHAQLEGSGAGPVFGAYLDAELERLFVLWLAGNLTQVLAVYDGRRLAGRRVVSRGKAVLGDVVSEPDGIRPEILIERITSMSVCCHPLSLEVLRVGKRGALTEILNHPRGHADVGPGVRWGFLNHFEFENDRAVVTRVFPEGGPRYEFAFDPSRGRFQPTRATGQALREEQRSKKQAEAQGDVSFGH
jgi:hypothetical protein